MAPLSATLEKDELPSDEPAAAASRQRNSDRAGARASTPSTTLRRVKCPSAHSWPRRRAGGRRRRARSRCCRPATATATLLATAQRAAAAVAAARSASPSFARFYDLCSDVVRSIDITTSEADGTWQKTFPEPGDHHSPRNSYFSEPADGTSHRPVPSPAPRRLARAAAPHADESGDDGLRKCRGGDRVHVRPSHPLGSARGHDGPAPASPAARPHSTGRLALVLHL